MVSGLGQVQVSDWGHRLGDSMGGSLSKGIVINSNRNTLDDINPALPNYIVRTLNYGNFWYIPYYMPNARFISSTEE